MQLLNECEVEQFPGAQSRGGESSPTPTTLTFLNSVAKSISQVFLNQACGEILKTSEMKLQYGVFFGM